MSFGAPKYCFGTCVFRCFNVGGIRCGTRSVSDVLGLADGRELIGELLPRGTNSKSFDRFFFGNGIWSKNNLRRDFGPSWVSKCSAGGHSAMRLISTHAGAKRDDGFFGDNFFSGSDFAHHRHYPEYVDEPLDGMRRVVARRLTESKRENAHCYSTCECVVDDLLRLRRELNGVDGATKLSVTDFLIKASALAFGRVPESNVIWDNTRGEVRRLDHVDVSLAVAIEGGLITPIVTHCEGKSLREISVLSGELVKRARLGRLKPHEFQGGTFTISNLGMFDINEFSAVINPPQAMILAVGKSELLPSLGPNGPSHKTIVKMTLSHDIRAVSHPVAAKWLHSFSELLKCPTKLIL